MKLNTRLQSNEVTHEGGRAWPHLKPEQALRRSVMSCLLWEKEFYEDGVVIAKRIKHLAAKVEPETLAAIAIEARQVHNLRHVPLLLLCCLAKSGAGKPGLVSSTINAVVSRADELAELLAIYWRNGKRPLPAQFKKGLAKAFGKFDAYQLAKYNRDNAVKLRDVLFLCHAKPKDEAQAALWKQLVDGTLPVPQTWEVGLSTGGDKKEVFENLLREGKLGYLALLRNLRNMEQAGVDESLVFNAIRARKGAQRVLPFRYVAAARAVPRWEPVINEALCASIDEMKRLPGLTAVLVDVSGSMNYGNAGRSIMKRMDAAAALASIIPGDLRVFTFSNYFVEVPPRRGMAGVDAIIGSQPHGGTRLFDAVAKLNSEVRYDRLIVITDEQTGHDQLHRTLQDPKGRGYMINVASNKNGVGYGAWTHIDGFSEAVLRFIRELEMG